jgi:protein SCO1/2
MAGMTRRAWLTTLGLAPLAGGVAAWAEETTRRAAKARLAPRERIQRNHLPNVELITHRGRRVRFYDDLVKDKKVVINFIYVRCEGICVPVTANLVRVKKLLGDRVGQDIFFYSITLKPEEDTPAALHQYAKMHHAGRGWLFLTGKPDDIETLRRGLGFAYSDPVEDADKSNHIGMVRFGNERTMRWAACPGLANPEHIYRTLLWDLG